MLSNIPPSTGSPVSAKMRMISAASTPYRHVTVSSETANRFFFMTVTPFYEYI